MDKLSDGASPQCYPSIRKDNSSAVANTDDESQAITSNVVFSIIPIKNNQPPKHDTRNLDDYNVSRTAITVNRLNGQGQNTASAFPIAKDNLAISRERSTMLNLAAQDTLQANSIVATDIPSNYPSINLDKIFFFCDHVFYIAYKKDFFLAEDSNSNDPVSIVVDITPGTKAKIITSHTTPIDTIYFDFETKYLLSASADQIKFHRFNSNGISEELIRDNPEKLDQYIYLKNEKAICLYKNSHKLPFQIYEFTEDAVVLTNNGYINYKGNDIKNHRIVNKKNSFIFANEEKISIYKFKHAHNEFTIEKTSNITKDDVCKFLKPNIPDPITYYNLLTGFSFNPENIMQSKHSNIVIYPQSFPGLSCISLAILKWNQREQKLQFSTNIPIALGSSLSNFRHPVLYIDERYVLYKNIDELEILDTDTNHILFRQTIRNLDFASISPDGKNIAAACLCNTNIKFLLCKIDYKNNRLDIKHCDCELHATSRFDKFEFSNDNNSFIMQISSGNRSNKSITRSRLKVFSLAYSEKGSSLINNKPILDEEIINLSSSIINVYNNKIFADYGISDNGIILAVKSSNKEINIYSYNTDKTELIQIKRISARNKHDFLTLRMDPSGEHITTVEMNPNGGNQIEMYAL